ncbi:Hypothetical Protein FCC1311_029982 [Hondaea fermentalgiana]|uniref:Uncharacterized protein n=1 Tax=Hondaea fermentalgiana TaxID=2315210 RepID=A0A2R5G6U8_9STRA|nr:Hypothetical Protein FCC1311_029982 [Hondaea fermentalgiana]|eukprot:GBG26776.1 Hypothetical Protein FCC1311_029982 [Hondaea fermentalgiana]
MCKSVLMEATCMNDTSAGTIATARWDMVSLGWHSGRSIGNAAIKDSAEGLCVRAQAVSPAAGAQVQESQRKMRAPLLVGEHGANQSLALSQLCVCVGGIETSMMRCIAYREYVFAVIVEDPRTQLQREFTVSMRYKCARQILVDGLRAQAAALGLDADLEDLIRTEFPRKHFSFGGASTDFAFAEGRATALQTYLGNLARRLEIIVSESDADRATAAQMLMVWVIENLLGVHVDDMVSSFQRMSQVFAPVC